MPKNHLLTTSPSLASHDITASGEASTAAKTCIKTRNTSVSLLTINHIEQQLFDSLDDYYDALSDYFDYAESTLSQHLLPGAKMRELDEEYAPLLIASENARNPKLRLGFCASLEKFAENLRILADASVDYTEESPVEARFLINAHGSRDGHFIAVDVRAAKGKLSLLMLDCAETPLRDKILPALSELNFILREYKAKAQKSGVGCVIFSLSFALKLQKYAKLFDSIHIDTLKTLSNDPDNLDISDETNLAFQRIKREWEALCHDQFPAAFYKHIQSKTDLDLYLTSRPTLMGVNTCKNIERPETLRERFSRYEGTYHPKPDGTDSIASNSKRYSESLGYKRLQFIKRAMIFYSVTKYSQTHIE